MSKLILKSILAYSMNNKGFFALILVTQSILFTGGTHQGKVH